MKTKSALAMIGMATAMLVTAAKGGFPELPLVLGTAGDFVILGKSGITTDPASTITGDMGVSPITASAITGFALVMDSLGTFSTSAQVTGKIYASDYADPTPANMTVAIGDMETAYGAAALRSDPDTTEFKSGNISGQTITPGLHKWSTGVLINTDVWLDAQGDADAVFIFQISGDLTMASYQEVILMGGAQAKNIFWQVAGGAGAVIGTYSHFEGILLTAKKIDVLTGASFNGKLLAQTAVNLQGNFIMDADLIPQPEMTNLTLTIISEHGVGTPLAGLPPAGLVYTNDYGVKLTNAISGLEQNGGTQYVAIGWVMTGNKPTSGSATNMVMVLTNNAVLTWQWNTNYLLNASAVGNGLVAGDTNGFYVAGSTVVVTATPSLGYQFAGWTGDVGGASTNDAALALTMDQARTVVAHFSSVQLTLTIISEHGVGAPLAGLPPDGLVYTNDYGSTLTNLISGLEENGGTQYVAVGWAMTGNEPVMGSATNMAMVLTNNAVLTWLWSTNYYLSLTSLHGSITNEPAGWKPSAVSFGLHPEPDFGYAFDHWEVNGVNLGSGVPLTLTMTEAKSVVAFFTPLFVDVTGQVDWNVNWVFDPRKGYFIGTLTITNRVNSRKTLLAPIWFEVESTDWHWLRFPTGVDTNTGMHYLDISTAVTSQLPGIGDGDLALDPGEAVSVAGIQLMGRRTPAGLVVAVWADPPDARSMSVDTDGDGMPDVSEYIAGTSATDPNSHFRIRLGPDGRSVQWDCQPNRIYKVLTSTDLRQGFVTEIDNIEGTGVTTTYTAAPNVMSKGANSALFYRVEVKVK